MGGCILNPSSNDQNIPVFCFSQYSVISCISSTSVVFLHSIGFIQFCISFLDPGTELRCTFSRWLLLRVNVGRLFDLRNRHNLHLPWVDYDPLASPFDVSYYFSEIFSPFSHQNCIVGVRDILDVLSVSFDFFLSTFQIRASSKIISIIIFSSEILDYPESFVTHI